MPDIYEDLPARRIKRRWQGGSLDNAYFGNKGGLFYGSQVDVDAENHPIKGTEKRRSDLDFTLTVTQWVDGQQVPTATGKKLITFTDPITGLSHTVSYAGVMNAMAEIVSTEGQARFPA